jgi:hypothetical protein
MPRTGRPVQAPITFDESALGEAMRALPPAQRCFVHFKVFFGRNNTDAARMAGYSENGVDVAAHRLAHHPGIQAAILEEGQKLLRSQGPKSILTLVEIRDNLQNEAKDRMKAAVELLNRSGFTAVTQHNISVEHSLSEGEKDRRILALAAELGLSPAEAQKMLVSPQDMQRNAQGVYDLPTEPSPELPAEELAQRDRTNERRKTLRHMSPAEKQAAKAAARAEQAERLRQEYAAAQVTDAEFEETGDPLADLADVL